MTLERSNELLVDIETALLEAIMDAVISNTFDKTAKLMLAYKELITTKNMRNNYNPYVATPYVATPYEIPLTYTTTGNNTNIPNTTGITVGGNMPFPGQYVVLENHTNLADYVSTSTEVNLNE